MNRTKLTVQIMTQNMVWDLVLVFDVIVVVVVGGV
jgi:hypothetical protein